MILENYKIEQRDERNTELLKLRNTTSKKTGETTQEFAHVGWYGSPEDALKQVVKECSKDSIGFAQALEVLECLGQMETNLLNALNAK